MSLLAVRCFGVDEANEVDLDSSQLDGALHWTRTLAGKTVTRTLTEAQATRYQAWFDNARRLRDLITDLETRSLRAFEDAED